MFAQPYEVFRDSHFVKGVGVHSGKPVEVWIRPGANFVNGVKFIWRRHRSESAKFAFTGYNRITNTQFQTVLTDPNSGLQVKTIEHFMAAIAVLGIVNAEVVIYGEECELPILDGSAWPWIEILSQIIQPMVRPPGPPGALRTLRIIQPVRVGAEGAWCELTPINGEDRLELEYELDYPHPKIGRQQVGCVLGRKHHRITAEIVKTLQARTFGFEDQAVMLRLKGFALGASLENTVVFNNEGVINPEGLRHPYEPAHHKLLDAIGDLSLARAFIVGKFHGYKSGHALNNLLLRAVFADPRNYVTTNFA